MAKKIFHLIVVLSLFSFTKAYANLGFQNVSISDLEQIIEELSANFTHTTVTGAGAMGSIFGFQAGLIVGLTSTPNLDRLSKELDPGADASKLPHGGIFGVVSVPFGITVEALFLPSFDVEGGSISSSSFAVKWTLTENLIPLPIIDLALRAHYSSTELEFSQDISGIVSAVSFNNKTNGLQALVGANFIFVKPYFGLGIINGEGDFKISGSTTFFDFTTSTTAAKSISDTQIILGAELSFLIMHLGLEYSSQFGTNRYTAKLALGF